MRRAVAILPLLAATLGAAARADDAPARPAAPPVEIAPPRAEAAGGSAAVAPKVRASHRVDVIAPGERVETVIDRMRGQAPSAPRDVRNPQAVPLRGPDRSGDRFPGDATRPEGGSTSGGGGTQMRGDSPSPERPRGR